MRGSKAVVVVMGLLLVACDGAPASSPGTEVAGATYRPAPFIASSPTVRFFPPRPTPTSEPTPVPAPQPPPWAVPPVFNGVPVPPVSAAAALVMDEASAAVLFEKEAHARLGPASLTKIATAILAIEAGDLDRVVEIDVDASEFRRSTLMGLEAGDEFTLRDLLYGLMLPSGNDAAVAIGRAISGSDDAFVAAMNDLASRLGLVDTLFANPHGLGADDHRSSAHDLAILARFAMSLPDFPTLAAARSWTAEGSRTLSMSNLNPMLGVYPGADGVKTGYTRSSGKTLIVSASRDGHRIFVVLLNAPEREDDATLLLDWALKNHGWP
jgi:D-alanyl-D-alanine carboxypeptidase